MGIYASPSGLLIAERDPTLALYPIALNDFATGNFLDAVTNINATTSGGSTLLAQEKFRNDFQRLTSDFPTLGYRASPAWTNLLYGANANAPSLENPADCGGWGVNAAVNSNTDEWAWHGSRSLKTTAATTGVSRGVSQNIAPITVAGNQYTASTFFKATPDIDGDTIRLYMQGDVSGLTLSSIVADSSLPYQFITVTKTFDALDTTRLILLYNTSNMTAGEYFYTDGWMLFAGSTVPQFEESECVATSCTFPTPFTVGEPFSAVFFFWVPWAGDGGTTHYLMINGLAGAANSIRVYKGAANFLIFEIRDAANNVRSSQQAVNWGAGTFHRCAVSRSATGVQNAALDGTTFATVDAGAGTGLEGALAATTYFGSTATPSNPLNGIILPFVYRGVAWGDAECQRMSQLGAPPPRTRRVA